MPLSQTPKAPPAAPRGSAGSVQAQVSSHVGISSYGGTAGTRRTASCTVTLSGWCQGDRRPSTVLKGIFNKAARMLNVRPYVSSWGLFHCETRRLPKPSSGDAACTSAGAPGPGLPIPRALGVEQESSPWNLAQSLTHEAERPCKSVSPYSVPGNEEQNV